MGKAVGAKSSRRGTGLSRAVHIDAGLSNKVKVSAPLMLRIKNACAEAKAVLLSKKCSWGSKRRGGGNSARLQSVD